ncbi:MAG: Methenyltetrahydrofolate cyclohydrolase [Acetothermia bacterium 64_32]|nr:MAG: Methenyltetrahydrofolate cyclohydrolase [Acetothermia bacterium 64_32]
MKDVEGFLAELGSPEPIPGGGAAAALVGALAAALVGMVAGISARKAAPEGGLLGRLKEEAEGTRAALAKAMGEDAAAYGRVAAALRLPKGTVEEKAARERALQGALRKAAEVPLSTAERALRVLELCEEVLPLASRHLRSDIAVAVRLAQAAVHSALYNVDANCLWMKDEDFLGNVRALRTRLAEEADKKAFSMLGRLEEGLKSWLGERDSNPH